MRGVLLAMVWLGTLLWILHLYRRDRQKERARVREVLSAEVTAELKAERKAIATRQQKFAQALQAAREEQR